MTRFTTYRGIGHISRAITPMLFDVVVMKVFVGLRPPTLLLFFSIIQISIQIALQHVRKTLVWHDWEK